MGMRSTGLGKTELNAYISSIEKVDDSIVFRRKIISPVRCEVRNLFQQRDIPQLVMLLLKPANMFFVIKALFKRRPAAFEPENF